MTPLRPTVQWHGYYSISKQEIPIDHGGVTVVATRLAVEGWRSPGNCCASLTLATAIGTVALLPRTPHCPSNELFGVALRLPMASYD